MNTPSLHPIRNFRNPILRVFTLAAILPGLALFSTGLQANPRGANVAAGNVNFQGMGSARLDINNLSQKAIINWQSFNINKGEITRINQAGNAVTLNRVVSGNPTEIFGTLKAANGGVVVVNPSGIIVGQGGTIDVAGMLTMSTLDITNRDFLNGGADRYRGTTGAGLQNYGTITSESGDVVLMGNFLQNAGEVNAKRGVVAFGAGGDMVVDHGGGATISVRSGGTGGDVGIDNSGTVNAAAAELSAHGNVYALAIQNTGVVRASGYNFKGGKLSLSAGSSGRIVNTGTLQARNADGSGGQVMISGGQVEINAGRVDASGASGQVGGNVSISGSGVNVAAGATVTAVGSTGGTVSIASSGLTRVNGSVAASGNSAGGGRVTVEGSEVLVGSQAVVDVSGETAGGTAMIGGGFQGRDAGIANAESLTVETGALIIADAVGSGKGGNIILWSDGDTLFDGDLSARGINGGGFAEISGKSTLEVNGGVDLTTVSGAGGTLLLDPTDITIRSDGATGPAAPGTSHISNTWISSQLDAGTDVVISTNIGGTQAGNITVGRLDSSVIGRGDQIEWYQDSATTIGGTLSLLAMGDIRFNSSVHSAGQGGVNVVAGWDGTTGLTMGAFDMAAVLGTMNDGNAANDAAGLYNSFNGTYGSVFIGGTGTQTGVDVGSRWGDTNVAGHDLFLTGSIQRTFGWAQLGFHDSGYEYGLGTVINTIQNEWWGNLAGNVLGKNYIALLGGTEFGTGDTMGRGDKAFQGAGWGATGDIEIDLSGRLQMLGGTSYSSTQIGHGANVGEGVEPHYSASSPSIRTTRDGIVVNPNRDRSSFFSSTWRTNYAGDLARINAPITVTVDGDILMMGARGFDAADKLDISPTTGIFSLIGHGGAENTGSYHGNVTVTAHGATPSGYVRGPEGLGIQMLGGRGTRSFVQIGHATDNQGAYGSVWDMTRSGNITVTATTGAIRAQAHNQVIREGDINFGPLIPDDQVVPSGNASDNSYYGSYVHIGHGGQNAGSPSTVGKFTMPGGSEVGNIMPDNSTAGDITVYAGGSYMSPTDPTNRIGILLQAGTGLRTHAMIGHGGNYMYATNTADQTPVFGAGVATPFGTPTLAASTGFIGAVHVEADTGDIVVQGGDGTRPSTTSGYSLAYAKVGHGGYFTRGVRDGTITVLAGQGDRAVGGNIRFRAGRMVDGFAQLGHGGYESDGDILGSDNSAEITVTARGGISFVSPEGGPTDGVLSGDWQTTYNANPFGVGRRWIMLGHGGYAATTVMPNRQDITVVSGTGDVGNADGDEETGGILFVAGDTDDSFAQLGHGGNTSSADNAAGFTGDIVIRALGGGIRFDASVTGAQASASTTASLNGVTTETVTKGLGLGQNSYAQLGHGGRESRGVHSGTIDIETWGGVEFLGAAAPPVTQRAVTTAPIDAALNAGTNVWVVLADLRVTANGRLLPDIYANIVPGTVEIVLRDAFGNVSDTITDVPNAGTGLVGVLVRASDGATVGEVDYDDGLVRFTGSSYTGTHTGTGAVATYESIKGNKLRSYVQLGHGGWDADGPNSKLADQPGNSGDILIHAAGDIRFQGGATYYSYAQLGHGGYANRGAHSGDIIIDHIDPGNPLGEVGGLHFIAGHGGHRQYDVSSYVQLGHGGFDADGNHFGNIFVRGTQDANGIGLLVKAGDRADAYAQLGHGGLNARSGTGNGASTFGMNGDIDVEVTGHIAVVAGTFTKDNPAYDEDARLSAMIGHGGYDADPDPGNVVNINQVRPIGGPATGTATAGNGVWGHFGDIRLVSHSGDISFMAGSNIPVANRIDYDGNPLQISDPLGILASFGGGGGRIHYAQAGHGGYSTGGNHQGDISVIAENGSVNVVGGMYTAEVSTTQLHYAQIGHGSSNANTTVPAGHLAGDIKVHALGGNVVVVAGDALTNSAQIGHGGPHTGTIYGDLKGDISVIARNNLQLNSGNADLATNWGKIGHGDVRNLGSGFIDGHIHISIGNTLQMGRAIIGHLDYELSASALFRSNYGDTFIAVGRNNPYAGGPGEFHTTDLSVITAASGGVLGETRLYMPDSSSNFIADGTFLSSTSYNRFPAPGSGRADEQIAREHVFPAFGLSEEDAVFTPVGTYPFHGFGPYNIYYGGIDPTVPPVVPPVTPPVGPPVVPPGPDYGPYYYGPTYDAYFRGDDLFYYDGYDEALYSIAYEDAMYDESDPAASGWLFARLLDGDLGSEKERDEELERRRRSAERQVGRGGLSYYVYNPGTNRYSSYRVFGVPQGAISVTE